MSNSKNIAVEIVNTAGKFGGVGAIIELATFGYKGPQSFGFEELCEIQDEAKQRAAYLPESLMEF